MAEQQKQVWEKVRDEYMRRTLEAHEYILQTGQTPASFSLPSILVRQRVFQYACKPIDARRNTMMEVAVHDQSFERTGTELWREMMRTNVLACMAEMIELLETCPWKPWKTSGDHELGLSMEDAKLWEARLEVVDAFCFMMNCWMLLGGDGAMLANLYAAKMDENHARQKGGY